jgi:hypothetical protein
MSQYNARIVEKDILTDISSANNGSSVTISLAGADKFSCQAVYDVITKSARVVAAAATFASTDPDHPSQFLFAANGFVLGLKVRLTTSNTLPTPLLVATDYFVIPIDDNYFQLASSLANALAGTPIALSDVGIGNTTITPVALSGATVTFQKSNDGINWVNIQSATSITVDGSVMIEQPNVSYRYFKAVKALTAGVVDLKALTLVIGDPI